MLSKKEIKDIQSLGDKKHRDETGLFVAEGPKIVAELTALIPTRIRKILATDDWSGKEAVKAAGVELCLVTASELDRISQLRQANQVLAVVEQATVSTPDTDGLILYLDTIQDPGNFGTIIRIADWFGIRQVICTAGCADLYNPKVVQATMASIARVAVFYDKIGAWLKEYQGPVYAAVLEGTSVYELSRVTKGVLVIGNESKGVSEPVLQLTTQRITIPKVGSAESLNAAVATGIILSHITTQEK